MFCEGSLGKVNDKDLELFQNKLVHKFYWLESQVDYFGTSVNTSVVEKKKNVKTGKTSINSADSEANWLGVVNFHCMQMTLVLSVSVVYFR